MLSAMVRKLGGCFRRVDQSKRLLVALTSIDERVDELPLFEAFDFIPISADDLAVYLIILGGKHD